MLTVSKQTFLFVEKRKQTRTQNSAKIRSSACMEIYRWELHCFWRVFAEVKTTPIFSGSEICKKHQHHRTKYLPKNTETTILPPSLGWSLESTNLHRKIHFWVFLQVVQGCLGSYRSTFVRTPKDRRDLLSCCPIQFSTCLREAPENDKATTHSSHEWFVWGFNVSWHGFR